jgi:ankyrin repeat protein
MPFDLPFDATVGEHEKEAETLFAALQSGDEQAEWSFKWMHPRFGKKGVEDVRTARNELTLADAQLLVAREYFFDTWQDLVAFAEASRQDPDLIRFEAAVEAIVSGDIETLRGLLEEHPSLIRERSRRIHHATLLHYTAANGVEGVRQKTPPNAVEITRLLLEAGAEPDALADMYNNKCTTMSMLVSSAHPHTAGLQGKLAELLLDYGAALDGPGTEWQSALMTALCFGYLDTAKTLLGRGAKVEHVTVAAGLGDVEAVKRLLPESDSRSRHAAFALATQHGHLDVVRLLLDSGEDPNRYNLDGFHAHSTPLHQAALAGHEEVVRALVEKGARLDVKDRIYHGTPLGWARYGEQEAIARYLESIGAPDD